MWGWGEFSLKATDHGIKIDPETKQNLCLKGLGSGTNQVNVKGADSKKRNTEQASLAWAISDRSQSKETLKL